jgi:hypothetical protein
MNKKTGGVVVYLLVAIAGILLLPVGSPVITVTNTRKDAGEDLSIPDIQSEGSFVSVLTGFASVGRTVLDSPSVGVDGRSATDLTPDRLSTLIKTLTFPPVQEENKEIDFHDEIQSYE